MSILADLAIVGRWSVRVWRTVPWLPIWIATGSVLTAGLLVSFPWLWQFVVQTVEQGADPVEIRRLAAWMLVVGVAHTVIYTAVKGCRAWGNAIVSGVARRALLGAVARSAPDALRQRTTGDLVARLHDDAGDKVGWFLCSGIFRAWESLLVATTCMGLMAWSAPGLAVLVLAPLPLLFLAQALAQRALARLHRRVQQAISGVSDEITSCFSSIRLVQAAGLQPRAVQRFAAAAEEQRAAEVRAAVLQSGVQLLYRYGWQAAMGTLLLFGGMRVLQGQLSLGQFVTFEGLVALMVWPMFDFGTLLSRLPQTAVALRRIEEVLALPADDEGVLREGRGVRAEGMRLVDGEDVLLEGVDLQVGAGQRVALVGGVGAGKTLVMEVVAGLRAATDGDVRASDTALVPQEPVLLSSSVRDNVVLGREVSQATLTQALRVSQLHRDLAQLERGLDTEVGERGGRLSGGQRQRVAVARALVGDPEVLLLDDVTSALDAEVEAALWRSLDTLAPDVGALLVTHRVGTLAHADEIVVLAEGRVVQRGRHEELAASDGAYRRLYSAK
ncbi:MAG: ABC transporter ATP-binding protein/permease [Myxococcales bacterium]|nr:ABC transporter ATP-binding protein/permease [Myxococcales bacterium]